MIEIDGSAGEGGGQILRTALSLSMVTGRPFRMCKIRAGRSRPGLLRQHLVAVEAAACISSAKVTGAALGATEIRFEPDAITAGEYDFAIGSAGSTTLVLQTVLPPLLRADAPSVVRVVGGTHNPLAPCFEFFERSFLPALRSMGARVSATLTRPGFYPAGGGAIELRIEPGRLAPLALIERGTVRSVWARATVANLSGGIARRELDIVGEILKLDRSRRRREILSGDVGVGNYVLVGIECDSHTEIVGVCGEKGLTAEQVGARAGEEARLYLAGSGAAGEHLADQLLLPCACAGGGSFTLTTRSAHFDTNVNVISRFLPFECVITPFTSERERGALEIGPQPGGEEAPSFRATVRSDPF